MLPAARRLRFLASLLFLSGLRAASQAPPTLLQPLTENIPYVADATGTYLADLYQPSTPGNHPAIVAIHGGSWRSGRKSELHRLCTDLASYGYACFSIDYDTHAHSFPTSWQESRAAVDFLRDHAALYQIDPERIAVLGTSAGGQLAALVALAPEGPAESQLPSSTRLQNNSNVTTSGPAMSVNPPLPQSSRLVPIAAAVLFNGGYDLHPKHYLLRRYLGGTCDEIPSVCNDASPDFHIHPNAPPIFVGHGTHDHLIPYSQATTFVSLLEASRDPVTPFIAGGAGHSYWRSRYWYARNLAAAEAFLAVAMPSR